MPRNTDASRLERSCGDLALLRDSLPSSASNPVVTPRQPRTITVPVPPRFPAAPPPPHGAVAQTSGSLRYSGTSASLTSTPPPPSSTSILSPTVPSYAHSGSVPSFVLVSPGATKTVTARTPPMPPPPSYTAPRLPIVGGYPVPLPAPPPLPRGPPPPSPPRTADSRSGDSVSEEDEDNGGGTLTRRTSAGGDLATSGKRYSSCPNLLDELSSQFSIAGVLALYSSINRANITKGEMLIALGLLAIMQVMHICILVRYLGDDENLLTIARRVVKKSRFQREQNIWRIKPER